MEPAEKITDLQRLLEILESRRESNTVVHCHGVFDLLHIGHIRHLHWAKSNGDILVVSITQDEYVNKGPHRPVFSCQMRAEVVAALDVVDYVIVSNWPTAVNLLESLQPDIYVKDIEYKFKNDSRFTEELNAVEKYGGKVLFSTEDKNSSSNVLKKTTFNISTFNYLESFKERRSSDIPSQLISDLHNLRILIIGDIYIDEYCLGTHIGKIRRDSLLDFTVEKKITSLGGIGLLANICSQFSKHVDVISVLGGSESLQEQIEKQLNNSVGKTWFFRERGKTPTNIRYIEKGVVPRNIFHVTELENVESPELLPEELISTIHDREKNYDLILVGDYGFGSIAPMITDGNAQLSEKFFVFAPINAGNRGFSTIEKYSQFKFGCLNEDELRMICRDRYSNIEQLIEMLTQMISCETLAITQGNFGCTMWSRQNGTYTIPALAIKPHDISRAREYFFVISSLLNRTNIELEVSGLYANAFAALSMNIEGGSRVVTAHELERFVERLLK